MDNARDEIDWKAVGRWAEANEEPHLARFLEETAGTVRMSWDDALDRLEALRCLQDLLEEVIRVEVQEMRRWNDFSWVDIAEALGMSRQGARQKFQHQADQALADFEEQKDIEFATLKAEIDVAVANLRLEAVKQGWTSADREAREQEVRNSFKPRAARFIEDHMDRYSEVLARTVRDYKQAQ